MKILYTSDLHGCKWKYDRLFELSVAFKAEVVINGGDMLPKDGNHFQQGEFIAHELVQHFQKFDEKGIFYLCYLGNDDLRIFDQQFENTCNRYRSVVNLAQRKFEFRGIEFIGMNWIVDYPFRLKDRCRMDTSDYVFQSQFGTGLLSFPNGWKEITDWFSYAHTLPTIEDELNQLILPENNKQTIYTIHMPPYRLGLDRCSTGIEVGSKAVYDFLQKMQPMLSLHGHIHESPKMSGVWKATIDDTICVQPGQLSSFTYVIIDLQSMNIERHVIGREE